MNIAILGFGKEGKSVLKFLRESPTFKKSKIVICDRNANIPSLSQMGLGRTNANDANGIEFRVGENYLKNLEQFNIVFRSPGVPYNLPEIQSALRRGVVFSSATKLFFDLCPANIIGVTGTKGKSTTSTLIFKILNRAGFDAFLAGNIGRSALEILPQLNKQSWVVLELSSFQLQDLGGSPRIAVVLDTFPDHLDAHKNIKEYLSAKTNVVKYQKNSDVVFYFKDNSWSSKIANKSGGRKIAIAGESFGIKKNIVIASSIAAYLNCPPAKICKTLKSFRGLGHRLELVRQIGNIKFYNDSASTNPHTAAAAISYFSSALNPIPYALIFIGGGKDKNLDYSPLAQAIKASKNVKSVILFGENKKKIQGQLENKQMKIEITSDLESVVGLAYQKALQLKSPATILFSPGAASFDMFRDYKDRGKKFKSLVNKID